MQLNLSSKPNALFVFLYKYLTLSDVQVFQGLIASAPTPTGLTLNWKCGLVLARKKCDWKVFTCSKVGVYLCNKTAVLTTFQSVSLLTYFFHFVVIKNKTCFRRSRDSVGKYNKSKKIHYLVERKMWCSK